MQSSIQEKKDSEKVFICYMDTYTHIYNMYIHIYVIYIIYIYIYNIIIYISTKTYLVFEGIVATGPLQHRIVLAATMMRIQMSPAGVQTTLMTAMTTTPKMMITMM
jgi:hypothetical protein